MSVPSAQTQNRTPGPVVDTTHSPHARLRTTPVTAVRLMDAFWAPRQTINRERTIPGQLILCEDRIDNFRRASGKKDIPFQGIFFNDSDVYKWLEAASFSLATHPDPKLDADVDSVIAEVAAAQQPDGYLNTYYMFERASERFSNLKDMHEMYCAGHLFQAAVAHYRATGKWTLLEVATKLADHLDGIFGPGKRVGACGHEEAEMGLVELYRVTGETRYLRLAECMVEARGHKPGIFNNSSYHQDHLPFTEQTEVVGHAVRHMYLCCGAADVATETGNAGYLHALEALWKNMTTRRMYVTGGVGSRWEGEAFGADFELPNDRAYTETCAAIGSVMWNWRMLQITGESRFADLMELALYNGVLAGLSLDGDHYFYQNPLTDSGRHRRQKWFGCACCPPNVARLLASLPGYFYSVDANAVWVHLYASGSASLTLGNGETVALVQRSRYPWDGEIELLIEQAPNIPFSLRLRIPAFATGATAEVNGEAVNLLAEDGYAIIHRSWSSGDTVRLTLPMPVERLESHPYVMSDLGRIALKRGPIVYCLEQADAPEANVWDIALPLDGPLEPEFVPDLLGGVTVLRGEGIARDVAPDLPLYHPALDDIPAGRKVVVTWANREPGQMQVWIPVA
jgi:DUF1680 family protein